MECPQCKSNSTYHRSTTDDFRCQKCGFEFKKSGESSKVAQAGAGAGCLMVFLIALGCGIVKWGCGDDKEKPPTPVPEATASASAATSYCGAPDREPRGAKLTGPWTSYRCMNAEEAGASWPNCLKRAEYADKGNGCPGESRCCPATK